MNTYRQGIPDPKTVHGAARVGLSARVLRALKLFSEEETKGLSAVMGPPGTCQGIQIDLDGLRYLPADPEKYEAIGVLNDELRKDSPTLRWASNVYFNTAFLLDSEAQEE